MGPVILAIDGLKDQAAGLTVVREVFSDRSAFDLIGYVKFNDAVHIGPDVGAEFISLARRTIAKMSGYHGAGPVRAEADRVVNNVGIFLDLKLADTSGTNVNTVAKYEGIDILTVRDSVSAKGWLALRRNLGSKTKLALVSALTDMPAEECRSRYGVMPAQKILNDIIAIEAAYAKVREPSDPKEPFDMIVCSPLEVQFLSNLFGYKFQFIVPGIRDVWMEKGQQARSTGVREALGLGATYCVMGEQMVKGNKDKGISPEKSRLMTLAEVKNSSHSIIVPNDPLATLFACDGYYESPKDSGGNYLGPLVAYAGKYESSEGGKNFVGHCYFNIAKAEERPMVRRALARMFWLKLRQNVRVDVLLAMPMGGIVFGAEMSNEFGCRLAFAEKKVIRLADKAAGVKEESSLTADRHEINPGDKVWVFEDVCNNFSTTAKARALIESKQGVFAGIICLVNRSDKDEWEGHPVLSLMHKPSPQFRQDDPAVADLVAAGMVVWKPKQEWPLLKKAMKQS